jgi:hypothetical protein
MVYQVIFGYEIVVMLGEKRNSFHYHLDFYKMFVEKYVHMPFVDFVNYMGIRLDSPFILVCLYQKIMSKRHRACQKASRIFYFSLELFVQSCGFSGIVSILHHAWFLFLCIRLDSPFITLMFYEKCLTEVKTFPELEYLRGNMACMCFALALTHDEKSR